MRRGSIHRGMKRQLRLVLLAPVLLATACETTRSVGYGDGWVSSSPVAYSFSAPPLLTDAQGRTYRVQIDGQTAAAKIAAFDRHGMVSTTTGADVEVAVALGDVRQGEPGAAKIGKAWYPAFTVSVPYRITIRRGGEQLNDGSGTYENMLTFKNGQGFASREQAVGAIDAIRKLGQKGVEERARTAAAEEAQQRADQTAAELFEPRAVALEVPVVRSAAGVDLEQPYTMLRAAKGPEQVQQALAALEAIGTQQQKPDGSPNNTANYGVACGIAAAKLMLRDLRGAWDASKAANAFEPRGEEVQQIRFVIYQQEKTTGIRVIPEEDRAEIAKQEQLANTLRNAFGAPGK